MVALAIQRDGSDNIIVRLAVGPFALDLGRR